MDDCMWGICRDFELYNDGLFHTIVQYKIDTINNGAIILLPKTKYTQNIEKIRKLNAPPQYLYGDVVSPNNHPDIVGSIVKIHWHYDKNCCFYTIKVGEKIKSKRYFDSDLILRSR